MTVAQHILKQFVEENSALYVHFIRVFFKVLLFIYDLIVFIPYKIFDDPQKRLAKAQLKKAVPTVNNDPGSPWKPCYSNPTILNDEFLKCKTVEQLWNQAAVKFYDLPCMGTRKLVSVTKEVQADGRVFEKLELGQYQWRTFLEVDDMVSNVAKGLHEIKQQIGERVLIYSETREEFAISMIACMKGNFPVVTVYITLGIEALAHSINECKPTTVLASAKLLKSVAEAIGDNQSVNNIVYFCHRDPEAEVRVPDQLKNSKINILTFEKLMQIGSESFEKLANRVSGEDVAMIMYTSGSTAAPKGVVMLQKNMRAAILSHRERVGYGCHNRCLGYLPMAHMMEICIELVFFTLGGMIGYSSPLTLFSGGPGLKKGQRGDCATLKPTYFVGTPAIFNRIVQHINGCILKQPVWKKELFRAVFEHLDKSTDMGYNDVLLGPLMFKSIRAILGGEVKCFAAGGAPMNPDTLRFIRVCYGCPFTQGYGATETSGCGAVSWPFSLAIDEVGPPQFTSQLMLREWSEGGYSPYNKVPQGEILIGGDNVASGYLNNEELTRESFIEMHGRTWFATGDIGEFSSTGCLRVIDRKKDLLKLAQGEYISLGKVESYISANPLVENVCVCGDSLKDYIVAVIVPQRAELFSLAQTIGINETNFEKLCKDVNVTNKALSDIQYFCKDKLHKMEVPRKIFLCSETWTPVNGMLTAVLKIKRKNIEQKFKEEIQAMYSI